MPKHIYLQQVFTIILIPRLEFAIPGGPVPGWWEADYLPTLQRCNVQLWHRAWVILCLSASFWYWSWQMSRRTLNEDWRSQGSVKQKNCGTDLTISRDFKILDFDWPHPRLVTWKIWLLTWVRGWMSRNLINFIVVGGRIDFSRSITISQPILAYTLKITSWTCDGPYIIL